MKAGFWKQKSQNYISTHTQHAVHTRGSRDGFGFIVRTWLLLPALNPVAHGGLSSFCLHQIHMLVLVNAALGQGRCEDLDTRCPFTHLDSEQSPWDPRQSHWY